jgi:hypothetical protein
MEMLSEMLMRLKAQYPEKEDATVLMEPEIEYDYLIQIMDAVRGAEVRWKGAKRFRKSNSLSRHIHRRRAMRNSRRMRRMGRNKKKLQV